MSIRFHCRWEEFLNRAEKVRLLAFDLDDTLLNSDKEISSRNKAAIQMVRQRGIAVTICTARNWNLTQYYARQLKIDGFYSATSGCQLVDAGRGELISATGLVPSECVALIRYCEKIGAAYSLACQSGGYISPSVPPGSLNRRYNQKAATMGLPMVELRPLYDPCILEGDTVYKIIIHDAGAKECEQLQKYIAENGPSMQSMVTSKGIVNVFAAGRNKGTGLLEVCGKMGIPPENTCAFGDFESDVPMFHAAGLSVAMGNAVPEVQREADAVTGYANENGVADMLEACFLG
ncbi:MAG: HAD family hydrolase [Pseudoflavonifractor capillosus]|uniref:HAD family hydrolase n=1 Tax=Pseudoflavonifractor capillosus TaxID=106588 RepID=UPI0023F79BE2|nr:HAD family hydrolase [Pseudoflavonifractor capillosus]MCI5928025.1 HAD family hydrolase [Pseudoflavonifractor capillosus]MDY4662119.1 HAD family hydrolase [Pseudoflavonifractor capillosus]